MLEFRSREKDLIEIGEWLDINFKNKGLKPIAIADGKCGIEVDNKFITGEFLIITEIAIFLYVNERKQILISWKNKNIENIWLNWPLNYQSKEYKQNIIERIHNSLQ